MKRQEIRTFLSPLTCTEQESCRPLPLTMTTDFRGDLIHCLVQESITSPSQTYLCLPGASCSAEHWRETEMNKTQLSRYSDPRGVWTCCSERRGGKRLFQVRNWERLLGRGGSFTFRTLFFTGMFGPVWLCAQLCPTL